MKKSWKNWVPETRFERDSVILLRLKKIVEKKTPFQEVFIGRSPKFGKMLFLDGDHQSSEKDEFIYHESLVQPAMLLHPCPKKILILGTGEGATIREGLKHDAVEQIIAVDIDKEAVSLYKKYLPEMHQNSFSSPKLKLVYDSAQNYIQKAEQSFDVIIADLTDPLTDIASDFYSKKSFLQLEKILEKDGIFTTHLGSSDSFACQGKKIKKILADIRNVFGTVCLYHSYIPSFFMTWGFAMASSGIDLTRLEPEKIDERIEERKIKTRYIDSTTFRGMISLPRHMRESLF